MRLFELFSNDSLDVTTEIKDILMDILTPLVASRVPFVTIESIIEKMAQFRLGVAIDQNLIMTLLDPNEIKIIDKIEDDKVFLNLGIPQDRAIGDDDGEREQAHVSKMAGDQAAKAMKEQ